MTTVQRILLPAPPANANVAAPPPLRHLQPLAPALPSHVPVARPDRVAGKPQLPGTAASYHAHRAGFGGGGGGLRDRSVPSLAAHAHALVGSSSSSGGHSDGEAQQVPGSAMVPAMDGHVDILSVDSDEDGKPTKAGGELPTVRCPECGKCYRHSSGLHKHEWEHHELWNLTKTMCLSKHQQVQLLEAAKVLLALHESDSFV